MFSNMVWHRNPVYTLLIIVSLNLISCDDFESINVKVKQGVVSGKIESTFLNDKKYFSFKGVPFAEPPVADLRFLPPIPHKGWDGIHNTYENTPTCMQFNSRMRNDEPFGISGSEDCLYLSIFTPALDGNYPVLVFDFNDNFATGFNGTRTYAPDFFVEEDVIVVTINHRLGLFGYLTTDDEVIPGNVGVRDFILGLQWIKDNVEQFGGDSKSVTLMGSRGGAALVNVLLYSEHAKGLFNAVVMQSGTVFEPIYFYDDPKSKAFQLGKEFNISSDNSKTLLEGLQKIAAEQLLTKEINVYDHSSLKIMQRSALIFTPTVEAKRKDAIVVSLPENGEIVNDVPVLIGFNSREGLDLIAHFIRQPRIFNEISHDIALHLPLRVGFRFDSNSSIYKKANREIYDFYYGKDVVVDAHKILDYAVYTGDTLHHYPINYAAKLLASALESPVYHYMFDFKGSLNENFLDIIRTTIFSLEHWGATVADELCYLHMCSRIHKNYKELVELVSEQPEIKVLKKMVRMWTNFAKTRNPTPESQDDTLKNFVWKPIDKNDAKEIRYLHITKNLNMKVNPLGKRAKFWDQFLAKYDKLAVNGVVADDVRDEL